MRQNQPASHSLLALALLSLAACDGGIGSEGDAASGGEVGIPSGSASGGNAQGGSAQGGNAQGGEGGLGVGGGSEGGGGPGPIAIAPCEPSGSGTDYQVGPGAGQIPELDQVPWATLGPGDTVRIFHRANAYKGKFMISAKGTASQPTRVCGVRDANGRRPVIDGRDAISPPGLAYGNPIHEQRGVIMVNRLYSEPYESFPSHIQIDGLEVRGAHPDYDFTDVNGQQQSYMDFGACIWVERGHGVTIADNEITDCTHAIFSRSSEDGDFAVTRDLAISGNDMHGNGVAGSYTIHNTYIQSVGVVYEFNRYGALRAGAAGNSIKDRSVGVVVRFNRIEDGARAMDFVEAEDYPSVATADPAYRKTFVYGNQIVKDGRKGSTIHYGGDHAGSESNYRKGTLYFWNNTVHLTGDGYAVLFQLSTTEETAEVWNNVFVFDSAIPYPSMRASQDNDVGYTAGGILNLGKNWIDARWADSDPFHEIPGELNGEENMITGATAPIDIGSMVPTDGTIVDAAEVGPPAAQGYALDFQLDLTGSFTAKPRVVSGAGVDLGAVEKP